MLPLVWNGFETYSVPSVVCSPPLRVRAIESEGPRLLLVFAWTFVPPALTDGRRCAGEAVSVIGIAL